MVSSAISSAQSIGMHLANDCCERSESSKCCLRARIWSSICGLELFLTSVSGRSSPLLSRVVSKETIHSTEQHNHLPITIANGNSGLEDPFLGFARINLYPYIVSIDAILYEVIQVLYDTDAAQLDQHETRRQTELLNDSLDKWHFEISSSAFDLDSPDQTPLPEQTYVKLRYFSTRMMINRHCLHSLTSNSEVLVQPELSISPDQRGAILCVEAARAVIRLLPTNTDGRWLFQCTPFWCVLYYVVQSAGILSLAIGSTAIHTPRPVFEIIDDARNALRWLSEIANTGKPAQRAWFAVSQLLLLALSEIDHDSEELEPFIPDELVFADDIPMKDLLYS